MTTSTGVFSIENKKDDILIEKLRSEGKLTKRFLSLEKRVEKLNDCSDVEDEVIEKIMKCFIASEK